MHDESGAHVAPARSSRRITLADRGGVATPPALGHDCPGATPLPTVPEHDCSGAMPLPTVPEHDCSGATPLPTVPEHDRPGAMPLPIVPGYDHPGARHATAPARDYLHVMHPAPPGYDRPPVTPPTAPLLAAAAHLLQGLIQQLAAGGEESDLPAARRRTGVIVRQHPRAPPRSAMPRSRRRGSLGGCPGPPQGGLTGGGTG